MYKKINEYYLNVNVNDFFGGWLNDGYDFLCFFYDNGLKLVFINCDLLFCVLEKIF